MTSALWGCGEPYIAADTAGNAPQSITVQNNVVEGYGRTIPASFGIGQGMGHDNLYTHNDVYDGYHCAISTSQGIGDTTKPSGIGNANATISFNHVYNLLQGIMNDGGSIRIDGGNSVFTAAGNRILNNKIHDVTDASIMDPNGYGGNGIYLDNNTGLAPTEGSSATPRRSPWQPSPGTGGDAPCNGTTQRLQFLYFCGMAADGADRFDGTPLLTVAAGEGQSRPVRGPKRAVGK